MKDSIFTIRLDKNLKKLLTKTSKVSRKNKSKIVIVRLEFLRKRIIPFVETSGFLTDDDIFLSV